jgi:nucleoside-diphosphate-sugar epimerase
MGMGDVPGAHGERILTQDRANGRTALVTGAGGFIGKPLCEVLSQNGWNMVAVRSGGRADGSPDSTMKTVPLRLSSDPEGWRAAMRSADCVVHLAARVHQMGADARQDDSFVEVNVQGSRFVAERAAEAGVRRFVYLSSIKVNGEGADRPYRAEDVPNPQDPYGRSKLAAEQVLRDVCERASMELVIIRPPLIYGPGVKANFRRLMKLVDLGLPLPFGAIENQRSLIGLGNLIDFIEVCMVHPAAAGAVWLIADEKPMSTPDLLRNLSRRMNRSARLLRISPVWLYRLAAPWGLRGAVDRLCGSLLVDSWPARTRLDWRARYSTDHELARTVEAFRNEKLRG